MAKNKVEFKFLKKYKKIKFFFKKGVDESAPIGYTSICCSVRNAEQTE